MCQTLRWLRYLNSRRDGGTEKGVLERLYPYGLSRDEFSVLLARVLNEKTVKNDIIFLYSETVFPIIKLLDELILSY